MTATSQREQLGESLATLTETLTSDYDVVQMLHLVMHECVELVGAQAAGLLLKNAQGTLELVASTSEGVSFVEVMQLNAGDGPCVEAARTGENVSIADVEAASADWVQFRDAALAEGYYSVHAVPLRVRAEVIGAVGLYRSERGDLDSADAAVVRALANIASLGILQERSLRESGMVAEQLQRALDSRIVIEQAKGVVAASMGVDMEAAFEALRGHARAHNLKLLVVAHGVVDRSLVIGPARGRRPGA